MPFPVIVLARNRPSQAFKQIATVTVHHTAHGDLWQLRVRLLLSIQRALLGEVTPNIRAVTATIDAGTIVLRWIVDGEISEHMKLDLGRVGAKVVVDFSTHRIAEEFIRCDALHALDEYLLDDLAYRRKE